MSSYEQRNKQQYHDQNQEDKPFTQKLYQSTTPTTRQTVKLITASTIGTALLVLSALVLTGTVIALVIATPIMVLFSPILVPAAITAFAIATGFVFSGACGVAALSALSWIYQYTTGKHPPGSDQLDRARMRIANAARDVKEKAKDNLQYAQQRGQQGSDDYQYTSVRQSA